MLTSFFLKEFVLATNMTTCPSAKEKLKWAFRLYDKDESGDYKYLRHFLQQIHSIIGQLHKSLEL